MNDRAPEKPAQAWAMEELIQRALSACAVPGLALAEEPLSFNRENLHRYMNGGAERYLGYSFDALVVARLRHEQDEYCVELYHFANAADAYGIWSTDCVGERVAVGQRATYGRGLLQFWRGHFYARAYHKRYRDSTRELILAIGRALADAIAEDSPPPEILGFLPQKGIASTPIYFHEQAMLDHIYFLSEENLLSLGPSAEALFAEYQSGKERAKILIVRYQKDIAAQAHANFVSQYLELAPKNEAQAAQLENGLWTGTMPPRGRTLVVVLDATSERLCRELLAQTARRLR